ncbi:MAG: hypothetical protein KA715_14050 [Xanthomonadaceae bacterium]|nr:hypothetical protein [Xanthomonadaceae bacterium]
MQTRFSDLKKKPELFEIFMLLRSRTLSPTPEMSLPFINDAASFAEICPVKYGVCQGITNLDRKLAMLIYYDPKNVSNQPLPPVDNPEARFTYFESVIAQVMRGKPMVVAGYGNLLSFAQDPVGRRVLIEAAMKLWASENATLPSITQVLQAIKHTVSKKEVSELHTRLSERIALNYSPIIYLARSPQEAKQKWIHVLQVISVTAKDPKNGSYRIQVKDPNFYAVQDRIRFIEMDGKGKATYGNAPLTEIDIAPGDDLEIARFLVNTIQFCRDNPIFCTIPGTPPSLMKN